MTRSRGVRPSPAHLRDGLALSVKPTETLLVDVTAGTAAPVDPRFATTLERLARGDATDEDRTSLPADLFPGVAAPGPAGIDPVLRARLRLLDAPFWDVFGGALDDRARAAYEHTLDAHARRKCIRAAYGQCPTLPETALRRALLVGDACRQLAHQRRQGRPGGPGVIAGDERRRREISRLRGGGGER